MKRIRPMRQMLRPVAVLFFWNAAATFALAQEPPRTVHVFVALADNQNQGIVPVPARLGNGEDPVHNLYWGAAFGISAFFSRSPDWELVRMDLKPAAGILERHVFRHRKQNVYLVADAYQGNQIQRAIADFLDAASGANPQQVSASAGPPEKSLRVGGAANLVVYVGHNGLMDAPLKSVPQPKDAKPREAIILACASKSYFASALRASGAFPLLWTTGLMAPEAYTLKGALDGWILQETHDQIRTRAARAYDQYQRCGFHAAYKLLTAGW